MAMPQRDNDIEQIHRLEGLIAYAEEQKDWDEVEQECEYPVEVAVKVDGNEVFACRPDLAFLDVKKFYWWHNLRHLFGGQGRIDPNDASVTTDAQLPTSAFRQDANFYFVHGYNMAQHEAREWAQATYKRLWWSGFRGRFHAVTWYSNDSQLKAPLVGYVCPNYQANVEHAFASASSRSDLATTAMRSSTTSARLSSYRPSACTRSRARPWRMKSCVPCASS